MDFDLNREFGNSSSSSDEVIVEPALGMSFNSVTEFAVHCHTYAYKRGFQYNMRSCECLDEFKGKRKSAGLETEYEQLKRLRLGCVKGGKRRDEISKTQVTGCKAFVDARLVEGKVTITTLELTHNHPMDPSYCRLMANYKFMTPYHKRRILNNDAAGVPIKKNFNSIVVESGGHENIPFTETDMRNMIGIERRRKRLEGDAAAMEEHFKKMKDENPSFFSAIQTDDSGRLKNVFWSDARCRAVAKDFGDVVTFDTTHLINRYGMPFAPFIGVNHHGSSVVLACGLVGNEDAVSFAWLFRCWLECMGRPPNAILTDQCKAIGKAVQEVFPNSWHRLCLFHILQNAARNLGKLSEWKDIQKSMKVAIHDSLDLEEFEEAWMEMVDKFQLHDNSWITDAYTERRRWVPGYWRDTFWAGMSSTQRSEGINFFFKGYMNMSTGLKLFIDQYQKALASKVEEEKKLNLDSMERPLSYNGSILVEDVFHKAYTNTKFKEVQDEVRGLMYTNATLLAIDGDKTTYEVVEKIVKPVWRQNRRSFKTTIDRSVLEFKCSCRLFEFRGILCKHIIQVIEIEEVKEIPESYVLDRWRKNLVREYERIQVKYYDPNECERVKKFQNLCLRNDYLVSLALHSDDTYNAYVEGLEKLQNQLESTLGIACNNDYNSMRPSIKVFGKRRLQRRENNERYIARGKKTNENAVKDPPVAGRRGRPPIKRTKHPSEEGSCKRKKTTPKKKTCQPKGESIGKERSTELCNKKEVIDLNEPSREGWFKLNTAGLSKINPAEAGGGGIFYSDDGNFFVAYVFLCEECETLAAEIWAILHGLEVATDCGLEKLIIETDSVVVCELLKSTAPEAHPDFHLLERCQRLIQTNALEVQLHHISKSMNSAAILLADYSFQVGSDLKFFNEIPSVIG